MESLIGISLLLIIIVLIGIYIIRQRRLLTNNINNNSDEHSELLKVNKLLKARIRDYELEIQYIQSVDKGSAFGLVNRPSGRILEIQSI